MTKTSLYIAALALTLTACASDEILDKHDQSADSGMAINFSPGVEKMQRAPKGGQEAAAALGNSFVVYGYKTVSTGLQTVFDHYNVNYTNGSANTTTSNTAGWEYVNQTANVLNTKLDGEVQDIKYWDLSATDYNFVAFSVGTATQQTVTGTPGQAGYPGTPATGSVIITPVDRDHLTAKAYTITGATTDLTKVYIADRVTATKDATAMPNVRYAYKDAIQFAFKPLSATIRLGFYETIPGYSVKDVKFYQQSSDDSGTTTAALYAGTQTIPSGNGIVNVSFPVEDDAQPAYNKVKVAYDSNGEKTQTLTLGAFTADANPEESEDTNYRYLGRASSEASMTAPIQIVPAPASDLTLKMDFTLVSIDYNETIDIKGAVATIPAAFTNWQPNHSYTYLFKLSDMVIDVFGRLLYPVTFDALETEGENGVQQTITTIDQPSITTYAKGVLGSDYYVGDNIYVSVMNGALKTLDASNSKLYTVRLTNGMHEDNITEQNIIDHLAAIEAGTYDIHLDETGDALTFVDRIDAQDSTTGDVVYATVGSTFGKFTAGNAIYVFEYIDRENDNTKHFKVIRVASNSR